MTAVQLALPLNGGGRCGYCRRPMDVRTCAHCESALREIATPEEWITFHRSARRRFAP